MATNVKLALIGCGNIAQAHWRGIQTEAPQIEVTTIVDTDSKQAAAMSAATGAQAFDSLQQALAKGDFDAVDIMLPHHLHEEAATTAFAAGKHVVLEKPMAPTLDACDRIIAAAQAAGTVFMSPSSRTTGPTHSKCGNYSKVAPSARLSPTAPISAIHPASTSARSHGATNSPNPAVASAWTAARTGFGRCECGWAK